MLVLDTYHHFDYPEAMLGHIHDSLLSDGRLVIVDYYKRPDAMPGGRALEHIRLDEDDVIKEVEANGFQLVFEAGADSEDAVYGCFCEEVRSPVLPSV